MQLRRVLSGALIAVALIATIAVATHLTDLTSQYYAPHSGQILVSGQTPTVRDSHVLLLDSSRYYSSTDAPSSLSLFSLVRVLSNAMGLTESVGLESKEATQMTQAALGKKLPKSQVIFNIESVGKNTLDRFQLNALSNPTTPHVALELTSPPITPPSASISIAASLSTGAPISSHGIVGPRWKNSASGKIFNAFSKSQAADSFSVVPTLADYVATHTAGKGLTLSVSGSESLAWAFGVNKVLSDSQKTWTNNYCIALTHGATVFQSVSENSIPALDFQIGNLEKQMESSSNSILNNLGSHMHATLADHIVTFTYSTSKISTAIETVKFDLKKKADVLFLSELQYVLDLPSKLKQVHSLASSFVDDQPDLLVISFAGFTSLLESYGRESEQFRGALHMLNQLFPLVSSEFMGLFTQEQPTIQAIVLMGSHPTVLEKQDPRQVEAVLKADNINNLDFFPNIYVPTGVDVSKVCQKLNADLAAVKYIAYCPSVQNAAETVATKEAAAPAHHHMLVESTSETVVPTGRSKASKATVTPAYYFPTDAEVQRFQIILWLSILLALCVLGAVYSLAFMSFKKDTMLYSSFNPNWEDRKRR